jgi:hypothetical protein
MSFARSVAQHFADSRIKLVRRSSNLRVKILATPYRLFGGEVNGLRCRGLVVHASLLPSAGIRLPRIFLRRQKTVPYVFSVHSVECRVLASIPAFAKVISETPKPISLSAPTLDTVFCEFGKYLRIMTCVKSQRRMTVRHLLDTTPRMMLAV